MSLNPIKNSFHPIRHDTWSWKLFLIYDMFMMLLIVINLFCLAANAMLMSDFGASIFTFLHLPEALQFYRSELHPWVIKTEEWFTGYLIVELLLRWLTAIIRQHHPRWFFFPFVHWYEILAIMPELRFLRLLRASVIAYRLSELGYQVIPEWFSKRVQFYYHVMLEELSSRIVLTVLEGIKRELSTSTTHKQIIHDLVDHHRQLFANALVEILQETLATQLQQQQQHIAKNVGLVVNQAIEDTPELTQLLRLIPLVGGRIEQQIQSIGQRLGENISLGLMQPWTSGNAEQPNPIYREIAENISQLNIENVALEQLVESAVFESLDALHKQVKVKQWLETLEKHDQGKE